MARLARIHVDTDKEVSSVHSDLRSRRTAEIRSIVLGNQRVNLALDSRLQVAGFLGGEIALHRDARDIEKALLDVVLLATYQPLPYGLQMPYLARSVCTKVGKIKVRSRVAL
jgi:hypothetical protein